MGSRDRRKHEGTRTEVSGNNVVESEFEIVNEVGLHARPAAMLVQVALKFQSDITIEKNGQKVNGKSIMGVLMLAAGKGSKLVVRGEGPDAEEAVLAIGELIASKFGED